MTSLLDLGLHSRESQWSDAGPEHKRELVVDLFCGGGGVSLGLKAALGRSPDIAINHNWRAVAMHRANHESEVLNCNVWTASPTEVCRGRRVGLLWASPDCRHHSRSRAGVPKARNIRDLPWVVCRWAREVRPRTILIENVKELLSWGPLDENGQPDKTRAGETFRAFLASMRRLKYRVDYRVLCAADYGIPTLRERLFLIMRCDDEPIVWPSKTHAKPNRRRDGDATPTGPALPHWRTARTDVVDLSRKGVSIYASKAEGRALGVKRPLIPATMRRIAQGVRKYDEAFVVTCNHADASFRGHGLDEPFRTVTAARDAHGVVFIHVTAFHGGRIGSSIDAPMPTITSNAYVKRPGGAVPIGLVYATAVRDDGPSPPAVAEAELPDDAVADLRGLVKIIDGVPFRIVDVSMRMLDVGELYRAQGFPDHYITDHGLHEEDGVTRRVAFTKSDRIAMCGNAVPPRWAELLARSNFSYRYYDKPGSEPCCGPDLPLFPVDPAGASKPVDAP